MALRASTFGSASYVHLLGSPAFLFPNMPGMFSMVPKLRTVAKNHNLSLTNGPPSEPLMSQLLCSLAPSVRPRLLKLSSRLLPCDHPPALLKKPLPEKVLPPVFGTMLTLVPPTSASPSPPERVRFN